MNLEDMLSVYAEKPNEQLLAQIVQEAMPLCRLVAAKFRGRGVEDDDLLQIASLGLLHAIERFEPQRKLKFSTYAVQVLAGEIRNYIRDKVPTIRLSRDHNGILQKVQREWNRLAVTYGREPSIRQIASAVQLPPEKVVEVLEQRESYQVISLDASTEDDAQSLEEKLGYNDNGYEKIEQKDWMEWVNQQLTPIEKQIMRLRYIEKRSQRSCASELSLTQMQICRMEKRMLMRLKEKMEV